ncbi:MULTISPECIES: transglycosylase SLT domain-containing protein [unclassified Nocardia]|uniref:aggregation-promoting factor C-terminal-like domain-containing protein n=1 Tax=unclassified Nocardia TaxID=2637762 RepID=UPI0035E0E82F
MISVAPILFGVGSPAAYADTGTPPAGNSSPTGGSSSAQAPTKPSRTGPVWQGGGLRWVTDTGQERRRVTAAEIAQLSEYTNGLSDLSVGFLQLTAGLSQTAPTLLGLASGVTSLSPGMSELSSSLSELASSSSGAAGFLEPSWVFPRPALKAMALSIVPLDQFGAFDQIISHESSWRVFAVNPSSGAYGLAQALPAHKMGEEGPDWIFNPLTQLRWAYKYMNERYGSPMAAWAFWQEHNWY